MSQVTQPLGSARLRWVEGTGIAALAVFAAFAWSSTSLSALALAGLVFAFLLRPEALRRFQRDPIFALFIVASGYLIARTAWAVWEFPAIASDQHAQAWSWFRLWFFIPVAWWLGARLDRVNLVLLLALASLFGSAALHMDWSQLPAVLFEPDRTTFHRHPNPFALYVATALLGLLVFAPRWWGSRHATLSFAARGLLWWLVALLLVWWLLSTQTRGAWLAVLVVFPVVVVLRLIPWLREHPQRRTARLISAAAGIAVLLAVVAANFPFIKERILQERQAYSLIAAGDLERLPPSSTSSRVHLYRFGLTKTMERPVFGWGPGSTEWLVRDSGRQELLHPTYKNTMDWLDHLHSTYLELLVRYGLVGALIAAWLLTILLHGAWRAYHESQLPTDYALFVLGAFGLVAIWSAFDYRLDHYDWRHYWILLAGVAYTFELNRGRSSAPK